MNTESFSLGELAALVGARLVGDSERRIRRVAALDKAEHDALAFCTGPRYLDQLRTTQAGAVLVKPAHAEACPTAALVVDDPYYAYALLANHLYPRQPAPGGIHPSAVIADDAEVDPEAAVGPNAVVEAGARVGRGTIIGANAYIGAGAHIGEDTWLAAGVYIGAACEIGAGVIVHSGVVIGADGFGFAPGREGWRKVPQLGKVIVGNRVDIGANTTIDRGALDDTVIEDGVKLDNLVHIAHNVRVGENTVIAGCTVIAGSTRIGKNCIIGGASAITGHVDIADGVTLMGMTGVSGNIREAGVYASPTPAQPLKEWRKNVVRFTQLEDIVRRLRIVERGLAEQHSAEQHS
ncbi:UDP-3-O-(3-hydroxymyristoyl)glucosamine N-acyltransferase [Alkalilimnicola ehrlichii]|uniref:UDP-3-O-acylglucosamine N-acyltransferase n=1 Tax=Alkalilimnicola ehrlichii TaxID=351052 RepID=A0A3E0X0B4_9GAMM|nr:UDP-3-O-(3-hydroxymyristoyl)glucosamine N-acyltransferase [Alkalilimnicola ehrlichii]RFA28989.1 UDP-3-O-(3-hydroxymyristoyl)glucosamine N-acyltransferase [Alkalilimnicola ehrlichii]RFA38625.1 UDP-3-O-(3-hydroxymyristoyl)glucosamine N-acyltransferase [Alkalilimnicola ehrlichii]